MGLLSSAQLGQLSLHNVVTMFHTASTGALADEEGMNLAGNLFFQRFNVTFDYPHRQLLVEQGPWFSKPFAYNRSGLKLKAGEGLILEGFTDGSAGTPETLLPGDELVAIAAEDGSWLTERAAIEARFREAAGTRLKLKIKRGKKELVRELELKEST
jgi:hypothetical protein